MNKLFMIVLGGSAAVISVTGAAFSIAGLTKLFAGAPIAVGFMAGALELCKMMAASFLHRNWNSLHVIMRVYMTIAVGVLMCITSMGIFGYLSYAYQHTAAELKNSVVRISFLESQQRKVQGETDRLQKTLDDIPANRVSKRMEWQKEVEPRLNELQKQSIEATMTLRNENLKMLSMQMEIGPVVFVAELFNASMDHVATYLILLFVFVFDPLAVCMVLATTIAFRLSDEEGRQQSSVSALARESSAA